MKIVVRNIKRLMRLFFAASMINWTQYLKYYFQGNSSTVVVCPRFWKGLVTNEVEQVLILLACAQKFFPDSVIVSVNKSMKVQSKRIIYSPSELFNLNGSVNYTEGLIELISCWESNKNNVYYPKSEIVFWENKAYMYRKFEECNVRHPSTVILTIEEALLKKMDFQFPLLVKEAHSFASRGVHKINSVSELESLILSSEFKQKNNSVIIQKLMKMRKDLRVIIIGNEIVLHYWRVNNEKEWKPTSTSYGSKVDFVTFPETWRSEIIDSLKKLNLSTGAFDIAWENDDLSTEPFFLEVSPSYQPNPPVDTSLIGLTYGEYKKKLLWRNSWDYNFVKIMFEFKMKLFYQWFSARK